GGHGSVAFSLVRGDRERTFDHGMVFYGVEDLASGYAEACSELGVTYELIHKRPGLDLGSWKAVVGALEKSAPDVIVLHSMPLLGAVAAFGRATRTPIVAVDHLSVHMKRRREWALTLASQVLADRTVVLSREFA